MRRNQIDQDRRKADRDLAMEAKRSSPFRRCSQCREDRLKSDFWSKTICKGCEKARFKQRVDALDEKYVRRLMAKTSTVLKGSDIPASLVQAKQMQMQIMRYLNDPTGEE